MGDGSLANPLAVDFAGTGSLSTAARSDHTHTAIGGKSLAQIECEARLGVWTGSCAEYATLGCQICSWSTAVTSCGAGRHLCTVTELQMAGFHSFASQVRRGLLSPSSLAPYIWSRGYDPAGSPNSAGNQIWYPWGYGSPAGLTCNTNAAPMFGYSSKSGGNSTGAAGCYDKTYTSAIAVCCPDGAF